MILPSSPAAAKNAAEVFTISLARRNSTNLTPQLRDPGHVLTHHARPDPVTDLGLPHPHPQHLQTHPQPIHDPPDRPPHDDSESRPAPNTIRITRHRNPTPYFPGTAITLNIPPQD